MMNPRTIYILKKFKDKLKEFHSLSNYEKENLFYNMYGEIPIAKELHKVGGELTRAFLSIGIDPLQYMTPIVPDWYLYGQEDFTQKFTIPKNIEEINDEAFAYSGITEINFHDNFDRMHYSAFRKCVNLETVKLPPLLEVIPRYCFRECANLKSVILSKNLNYIETGAFAECPSLAYMEYPGTMDDFLGDKVSLEKGWLYGSDKLEKIYCSDGAINTSRLIK